MRKRFATAGLGLILGLLAGATGCAQTNPSQRIIYLDGAWNFSTGPSVRYGMRSAGYRGEFEVFVWSSFLGWGADHLMAAYTSGKAEKLAHRIVECRSADPDGYLAVMGLSAGTAIILNALEKLPPNVQVDYVVLFQPSVSSERDLSPALARVRRQLYATSSRRDPILAALAINADGGPGPPAGKIGFVVPPGVPKDQRRQYNKVVNVPWRAKYSKYGWNGFHVFSTSSRFVRHVIADRIMPGYTGEPPVRLRRPERTSTPAEQTPDDATHDE